MEWVWLIEGTGDTLAGNAVTAEHTERAICVVSAESFRNSAQMWKSKMREAMSPTGDSQRELLALVDALAAL